MQNMKKMKYISGSIFKLISLILVLAMSGALYAQEVSEKDTLRTYGPRLGIDLARFFYLLADPVQTGAEVSADFEVYRNVYPVFELGFNSMSDSQDLFDYSSSGAYGRAGIDYNVLSLKDRSAHHSISFGFRYGMSVFSHQVEDVIIPEEYWGDYQLEAYENNLTGHWIELVGGMKAEVFSNFFLGWSVRYKILLNPEMDPIMVPEMIPGYGSGGEDRVFGITYSVYYKIPLFKK
jgi:hypothetical protein